MADPPAALAALLAAAVRRLRDAGLEEPRREALRIWQAAGDRDGALLDPAGPVDPDAAARFGAAVERRARGEPLAYAVGSIGFRTLTLRSDARALIPRPETEGLVELLLARQPSGRVADVGTGTGCIALSLRAEGAYRVVVAVDRSREALSLAGENARDTRLDVQLVAGDLAEPLATGAFDALVANPPYLSDEEYATLDASVRDWEPALALPSGADGLAATLRLLDDGRRVLRRGGWLALELDCRRAALVAARAAELGWTDVVVARDLFERERYLLARRNTQS